MNLEKLNASQLRVNGPLTCSLPFASQLRYAGSGHSRWARILMKIISRTGRHLRQLDIATRVEALCHCRVHQSLATAAGDESSTRPHRRVCSLGVHSNYQQSEAELGLRLQSLLCALTNEQLGDTLCVKANALNRSIQRSSVSICLRLVFLHKSTSQRRLLVWDIAATWKMRHIVCVSLDCSC